MNRATPAIIVLLVLILVVLLALLAVSAYDLSRESDCCSEIEEMAKTTRCVRAAATARMWRNAVDRLWAEEFGGHAPDCDEFQSVVDNLSEAADRCRQVCDILDCPSKSLTPERCR
ncbi:MAG: hypothetical protein P8189_24080 [Anaerolineae bacterium]|jgi:hypothetical protein